MFASIAHAAEKAESMSKISQITWSDQPLFWIQLSLLGLVLLAAPIYAICARRSDESSESLRGLNLPRGSVRAMLALLIVGSFVNVLVFGAAVFPNHFEQVVTVFGTLAGSVTGFYFGGRQASPPPKSEE